jgi:NADPH2:quinone reductase
MRAIRVHQFGDPSVMKLEEVPDRPADAGQVVVDVKAAGVNPVDTYIRSGQYAFLPPLPYTPGSDAAGVVVEVGSGVPDINVGDRVYVMGTIDGRALGAYAQRAVHDRSGSSSPEPYHVCRRRWRRRPLCHRVACALR